MKLRVLTYNIHKGFNTLNTRFLLSEIKQSIKDTQADLVFLQEVVGENIILRKKFKSWPTQSQFEFLADTVWKHFSYGKNAVFPSRHHGNAILSHFPILSETNLGISNHRWEQRGLLHLKIQIPPETGGIVHLLNTHIDLLASGRKKQIGKISAYIEKNIPKSEAIIFCGDFNDWVQKIGPELHVDHQLQEAHTVLMGYPAKTFPHFYPILSLDRIFFRGFKVVSCESLKHPPWAELSDHLPILAEFELG